MMEGAHEDEQEQEWIESPDGWGSGGQQGENSNSKSAGGAGEGEEEADANNIEEGSGDDDEGGGDGGFFDLFANTDPRDFFEFEIVQKKEKDDDDDDDETTDTKTTKTVIRLEGYKLDSDETAQSTGVTLWQAAPRLASFLQQQQQHDQQDENTNDTISTNLVRLRDQKVLELGAGLGLCGIVAYHCGAKLVMMTDGDTQTLQQMRRNVQLNCPGAASTSTNKSGTTTSSDNTNDSRIIDCKQLIWGSPHMEKFQTKHGCFDVILGADVIYTKESTGPLFDTVSCLLSKKKSAATNYSKGGIFVLSRYNKWNNVSDEIVLQAANERNLECTTTTTTTSSTSEGIFIFSWKDER